jgi:hypothetical protein
MRQPTSRPLRLAIALAASGALALTACGSDSDSDSDSSSSAESRSGASSSGSPEAFCVDLLAISEAPDDLDNEAGLALLQAAAASAPSEISDDMNQLTDSFELLLSFDEDATDDEMAEFSERAEAIEAASLKIEDYARDNCPDLPADFFSE